jgi:hypothetical protein
MLHFDEFGCMELRCRFGGGSGGGGSSGKVEYPAYLQTLHGLWLDGGGGVIPITTMAGVMNIALGTNPYLGEVAYDPAGALMSAESYILAAFNLYPPDLLSEAMVALNNTVGFVDTTVLGAGYDAEIAADVTAYEDMLEAEINTKILPKFHRGMQDINAVQASSFVIGEALIWAELARDVAKFAADIELRLINDRTQMLTAFSDMQLKYVLARLDFHKAISHLAVDFGRIKIVANKEWYDKELEIEEKYHTWDLKVWQYGGNLMAAISGAAATTNSLPSGGSMLGGALSGVASGAMMGSTMGPPGIGAGIGGLLGGIAGMFGAR